MDQFQSGHPIKSTAAPSGWKWRSLRSRFSGDPREQHQRRRPRDALRTGRHVRIAELRLAGFTPGDAPWAGTRKGVGAIVDTFVMVSRYWSIDSFAAESVFGDESNTAMFGRLTYTSKVLGKTVTSPFAVLCRVEHGKATYVQFMEDTFATSASFRSGARGHSRAIPTAAK